MRNLLKTAVLVMLFILGTMKWFNTVLTRCVFW